MFKLKIILIASIFSCCVVGLMFVNGPVGTVEAVVTSTTTPTPTHTPTATPTETPTDPPTWECDKEDECDCVPCAGIVPMSAPTVSLPLILFVIGSILFISYWAITALSNSIKDW